MNTHTCKILLAEKHKNTFWAREKTQPISWAGRSAAWHANTQPWLTPINDKHVETRQQLSRLMGQLCHSGRAQGNRPVSKASKPPSSHPPQQEWVMVGDSGIEMMLIFWLYCMGGKCKQHPRDKWITMCYVSTSIFIESKSWRLPWGHTCGFACFNPFTIKQTILKTTLFHFSVADAAFPLFPAARCFYLYLYGMKTGYYFKWM